MHLVHFHNSWIQVVCTAVLQLMHAKSSATLRDQQLLAIARLFLLQSQAVDNKILHIATAI